MTSCDIVISNITPHPIPKPPTVQPTTHQRPPSAHPSIHPYTQKEKKNKPTHKRTSIKTPIPIRAVPAGEGILLGDAYATHKTPIQNKQFSPSKER
jgi:hypothetical protein